jgi:glycosyltransferase involved in cell wall biosynthesis
MRFVFLTLGYHPDLDGGGYRYATEVAERLAALGHEVHAVYPNPRNALPSSEFRNGVQLHRVTDGTGSFFANWRSENAEARRVLDRLLAPGSPRTLLATHQAYFESAARGRATVFMYQGAWGLEYAFSQQAKPRGFLRRLMDPWITRQLHRTEGRALAAAPEIFVASEYTRRRLPTWHPKVSAPVRVVSGGANFTQFSPPDDRAAIRARWNLSPAEFLFLTVRRLDPRMGLRSLIEAFAKASKAHPGARLWLAGRGPQKDELQALIGQLGLADKARLLGFVPEADLASLYGAADVTLMPSLDLEGFGLATVESLACGTPVLASDAGANPELVGPLDCSLVYPTGDADRLAERLEAVLGGRLPLPPRVRCSNYARAEFRWDRPVKAFMEAHERHASGGMPA